MEVDYVALTATGKWKVVANLPYQVGTSLLLDWLRFVPSIEEFTIMVQLEVAQRLVASAGSDAYGLPSVVVGLLADAEIVFKVPPQVFLPAPKIDSAVVHLVRRPAPAQAEEAIRIASAGFGQRRKMLRGSLASITDDVSGWLERAGIDPRKRAESLSPEEFLRLAVS
jgi:16S rRNA (adenine1518-N6/adenine1519-N6)-dimethyltransferase